MFSFLNFTLRKQEGKKYLFVAFIHKQDPRALILSARDMDKKERDLYQMAKPLIRIISMRKATKIVVGSVRVDWKEGKRRAKSVERKA